MARDDRARLTRAELRKFGLTVGVAFGALAGLIWWRGRGTAAAVLGTLGGLLVLGGLAAPAALAPVERGWMGLARAISRVTTPLIMGLIYFVVITPIGLLRRSVGKHPLRHPESEGSFWAGRDEATGGLERQF
ncbi:MAG: SxtJ family membrane protein [Gemmatimonadota bacterium]